MIIRTALLMLFTTTCASSEYFLLKRIGGKEEFVESVTAISKIGGLPFCRAAITTVPISGNEKTNSLEMSGFFSLIPGKSCLKSVGVNYFFTIKNCIDVDYILKLSADAVNKLKNTKKIANLSVTGIRCSIPDNYISITLSGWAIGFKANRTTGIISQIKIHESSASAMGGWERKKISRSAAFQNFPANNNALNIDFSEAPDSHF